MAKQTILIVEDDLKVVELVKAAVEKIEMEFIIKIAYNGKEALDIIEKEKIDLALLDIHMPVMSGAQLLTELCNKKIWFPIIILTAYSVQEIRNKLLEYGIIDLLVKPLDIVVLIEKIKNVLQKSEHKDSISGLSAAAIMQILEMENRTGIMNIKIKNRNGRIFFQDGKVVDIEADGISGEEALENFLDPTIENKQINIEYLDHHRKKKMDKSFTQVVLDTSRLIDEKNKYNQEETVKTKPGEHWQLEKEVEIEHRQLDSLIENLKKELGDALISTAIWTIPSSRIVAGYKYHEDVGQVFTQITFFTNNALLKAKYPQLGKYYIYDLKDGKMSITIPLDEYSWGMLIDSRQVAPDFLLKEILPKQIAAFQEAIAS
jgi:two-component system alkaline phosphatase synthesis response regulator PhoP